MVLFFFFFLIYRIIRLLTLEIFLTKTGYLRLQEDTDQGTGYSTLCNNSDLNAEYSIQVEDSSFWDHNKYKNRCGCITLLTLGINDKLLNLHKVNTYLNTVNDSDFCCF